MKTLLIKMNDLSPDAAGAMVYPVQLFFDDGQADWLKRPVATINIPKDLSIPNPPLDPLTGKPIDGREIRNAFLSQNGKSPQFVEWGRYLHQLLFQDPLAQEWNRLHLLYPQEEEGLSEGLRTILDIKPDDLRWLPWELILQNQMALFFDSANPFSRGTLDNNNNKLTVKSFFWPVHVLIVVGSKVKDADVNAEQEVEAIQHAFIKSPVPIDWYVVWRPTKAELIDLIKKFKPQIFHFIGHGKKVNDDLFLELTDKNGVAAAEEWMVGDIPIDLQSWKPRFAFINACRSSSIADQQNSWDIARAFSSAGVPAVLGMQGDIRGDAATEFSRKLYESMIKGLEIDRALAEARAAVKNIREITLKRRDWALATLYLQQLPAQILAMKPPIDQKTRDRFRLDSKLKGIHDFVGRRKQRRQLWHGVDEIADYKDEFSNACIVVGNEQIGKTALVQASMKVCALRNRRISYVDVGYQPIKEFVDLLKIIRAGDPKSSEIICAPLPTEPFADFDNKYRELLEMDVAEASKKLAADNNRCEQFFNAYKAALLTIAATEPLIIVLDHLGVEWGKFNSVLVPKLLLPIAQNLLPNCRLVLVCTTREFDGELAQELKDAADVVDVRAWPPDKYVPLARQICLYNDIELKPAVEESIGSLSKMVQADWEPAHLRITVEVIKRLGGARK
jgi:hypothetical protein